ncbi:MAG: chitobiase/beta-hexosaminidase C-terminal domain-containing protein [Planctomycetes bacterium]|nr:chitobiase/beta-hexosaminidase C-terminal domain-containing protein [Planctomycetota bacterium]
MSLFVSRFRCLAAFCTVALVAAGCGLSTPDKAAAPVFDVPGGTYNDDVAVTITCATSGATIYYTTDGADPTDQSTEYVAPVPVSGDGTSFTLKAIAVKPDWNDSSITQASYAIDYSIAVAVLAGAPPAYTDSQQVNITVGGENILSYQYRLDGGSWSAETSVAVLISLSGLAKTAHVIEVIGKNVHGVWQDTASATSCSWTIVDATWLGAPDTGRPCWEERMVLVFTNMVRMAPIEYRDSRYYFKNPGWNQDVLETHPVVPPLYHHLDLNDAARYHAEDMRDQDYFAHDSIDGTLWSDRIMSFFSDDAYIGENIAAGYTLPWLVVSGWICDGEADDGTPQAGHRTNIMRSGFKVMGAGYAFGGSYMHYWVQDFGGHPSPPNYPVVAAGHDYVQSGNVTFLLNYYDPSGAPQSVKLTLDGVEYDLTLDIGAAHAGTYTIDLPRDDPSNGRPYYFSAVDSGGGVWRYPGPGVFMTYGEGSCLTDYVP